ncbi:hypothetical protein CCACVL1_06370, partial [Corchorus capsularis]
MSLTDHDRSILNLPKYKYNPSMSEDGGDDVDVGECAQPSLFQLPKLIAFQSVPLALPALCVALKIAIFLMNAFAHLFQAPALQLLIVALGPRAPW